MEDRMTAQQLKNSILQMAVQGKLVPQDPNDEPASVLLERIRKEKEQLIKDGKIKKNKKESYIFRGADNLHYEQIGKEVKCIEDELPFEIPDSWEWVHIDNISDSYLGKTLNKSKDSGILVPYLCSINIQENAINLSTIKQAQFSEEEREKYKLVKNDLLICEGGDVGRTAIWNFNDEMYFQNALHRVRFSKNIQPYYFLYVLNYFKESKLIEKVSKGVTIKHFVQSSLFSLYFPLPPLSEQERIINKIRELEPLIEKYKLAEEKLYELNSNIKDQLKKSILQYAIEGKLVPQDPNDEPASALLERIREEKNKLITEGKIKKDKNESIIYRRDNSYYEKFDNTETCLNDKLPYDLPAGWDWCNVGSLFTNSTGLSYKKDQLSKKSNSMIRVLRGGNIQDGNYTFKNDDIFISSEFVKQDLVLRKGYMITPAVTSLEHIGKIALIDKDYDNIVAGGFVLMLKPIFQYHIMLQYLLLFFSTNYHRKACRKITHKSGQAFYNLSRDKLMKLYIAIPPLEEQKRIIEKISEITNLFEL